MSSISEYGIASRLVQYVVALVSNATDVLMPAASHEQINDQHKIRKMALYSSKFTSILVVPIVFGFFIIGDSFIYLWLGKGFTQTYLILVILTTAHMFALPLYGMGAMLFGIAKHAILAKIIVWEAVMNLILSLFFVRYWGIIGVALGTVLPATFFNLFIVPWKVKKILELDMRKYYSTCLIKPYIMAIPFSITLLCYKNTIGCNTWLQLIGGVSSSLCVYAATVYHFDIKTLVHEKYGSIQNAFFLLRSHRK